MTSHFFDFILETSKIKFVSAQNEVLSVKDFNPYSDDLNTLESYLQKNELQKVVEYNHINLILSPRAHLYKNYALQKLDNAQDAKSELILAQKILEGISLTGTGSQDNPFSITQLSDEYDFLTFINERSVSQSLLKADNRVYDKIKCESGKEIYFDITFPYLKMQYMLDHNEIELPISSLKKTSTTKKSAWWKIWKS